MILTGHEKTVFSAQFSPDGKRILTASNDKTARIWNLETGEVLATLKHDGFVNVAHFSPDGRRAVTTSHGTTKCWPAIEYLALALKYKPRDLTPDERDSYQIGTLRERSRYRQAWEAALVRPHQEMARKLLKLIPTE